MLQIRLESRLQKNILEKYSLKNSLFSKVAGGKIQSLGNLNFNSKSCFYLK